MVMSIRLFFKHRNMFFDQIQTIQFLLINFIVVSINCKNLATNGTVPLLNDIVTTTDATTTVISLAATTLKIQETVDQVHPEHPARYLADRLKTRVLNSTMNKSVRNQRQVVQSSTANFAEGILLVISNLALLPAILICIRAQFRAEAIVYTYTMLYSMLYHICDFPPFRLCVFPFDVMQFADFFAAATAIWCTAILIVPVPSRWVSSLQMSGALTYGILLNYWRYGVTSFFIQAVPPVALVSIFWGNQYYHERRLPEMVYSRNFYAAVGLMAFGILAFASQTISYFQNIYGIMHSLWHAAMSFAIALLVSQSARIRDDAGGHWLDNIKARFTSTPIVKKNSELTATNPGFIADTLSSPMESRKM